jgi:RHS repeat-associated protein
LNNEKEEARAAADGPADSAFSVSAPQISLPKGGGAIRGIGEKFSVAGATGTGALAVPLAITPGRGGFGPQLSLSYDSGAGNGPFGFGWSLGLPAITRRTDRGLPRYQDAEESDVFLIGGIEDLVPAGDAFDDSSFRFRVQRFQPRIEGAFARIERWTPRDGSPAWWRSISRDNVTSWYGRTAESRIEDTQRVFSWLICESHDDKGNAIRYEYKGEDAVGVDPALAGERNRSRAAQRYPKRIKYCNRRPRQPDEDLATRTDWLMEVVFDYGEHYAEGPDGMPVKVRADDTAGQWAMRQDPFSSFRAGFEIRTYRLCQRVLMFHHFPDELGTQDCLVQATHFSFDQGPRGSFLASISQVGYVFEALTGSYLKRSRPPVEFGYSQALLDETVRDITGQSLANIPAGLDESRYLWADLDGEGLSGILTEQGGGWLYKRNLSALPVADQNGNPVVTARFAPLETLATLPSPAYLSSGQKLLDLAGDGQLDVVDFERPAAGFFERTTDSGWEPFRPFESCPNVDFSDVRLRFVDLTGDGRPDILISEESVFTWYPSRAEQGFAAPEQAPQPLDEEAGPRLIFADRTQSIFLTDLSGDGLADLVRIRNGEICYWPNLGYGRFGAKVTMDGAPWLDGPDSFDPSRIRLADIDGSGVADLVYLGRDAIDIYFNQSGNAWSAPQRLRTFPRVDSPSSVAVLDLLGRGTACLVWSSPLPGAADRPFKYIDLMARGKPHLLTRMANNLGAETEIRYAPSTQFYLADRLAGRPWITRLPFPVYVVEKIIARDRWRNTEFTSTYSYHHGYFDGEEQEFRGFGRVEQVDVERFDRFAAGNATSPYITDDLTLYQPPVKTITWFHTGAPTCLPRILTQFQTEYFPRALAALPGYPVHVTGPGEKPVAEPDLGPQNLSNAEWREALRACKGMTLRQEVYELDVDALASGRQLPVKLFSAVTHSWQIRRLQAKGSNRNAIFLTTETESLSYHYELDLRAATQPESANPATLAPDPRVTQTLNLRFDDLGNVLQSVAIGYPRGKPFEDDSLPGQVDLIRAVQNERHVVYTETSYTDDAIVPATGATTRQQYRLRLPAEVQTYELTGFAPSNAYYFDSGDFLRYRLSDILTGQGPAPVGSVAYHAVPAAGAQKRKVEHVLTQYFGADLQTPRPLGELEPHGLVYQAYKLALTRPLLQATLGAKFDAATEALLNDPARGGYVRGTQLPGRGAADQWWIASGIVGFNADARDHFYLPEKFVDPFDNPTLLEYDSKYDLFIRASTDARGNRTRIAVAADGISPRFDYRVMAPLQMEDCNGNRTEVRFDALGRVVALAVQGKGAEADDLDGYTTSLLNPELAQVTPFFNPGKLTEAQLRTRFAPVLGDATTRFLYQFGEKLDGNAVVWGDRPAGACAITRERHVRSLPTGTSSPLQVYFECSDGHGSILMKRSQAEPAQAGGALRWIVNGKTVLNNKGKPVKQYEPYFSERATCCAEGDVHEEVGVTSVLYYDAAGRPIRTEFPDGTFSRDEFSPWVIRHFDQNDTVKESRWYRERLTAAERNGSVLEQEAQDAALIATAEEKRAARLAANHAGTPDQMHLDSRGREVVAIAQNRAPDTDGVWRDSFAVTYTKLDTEGKPLWIRDARGNLVVQYVTPLKPARAADEPVPAEIEARPPGSATGYDIAGSPLFQHGMDGGSRWSLMDAAGSPLRAWDLNENEDRTWLYEYDVLHRPVSVGLSINGSGPRFTDRCLYRDTIGNVALAADRAANLIGQATVQFDSSGLTETIRRDFNGNVTEIRRRLNNRPEESLIDWPESEAGRAALLEAETYRRVSEFDALGRLIRVYNWHLGIGQRVAVYEPRYNERGLLTGEDLVIGTTRRASDYDPTQGRRTQAVESILYDVKGQRQLVRLGNRAITRYEYDPRTFRLKQIRTTRPGHDLPFPATRALLANASILQQLLYTYDPVGNVVEIEDQAYRPVFFDGAVVEPKSSFEYDARYRLISARGRESANGGEAAIAAREPAIGRGFPVTNQTLRGYIEKYSYDAVGNFLSLEHVVPGDTASSWTRRYESREDSNRLRFTWRGSDRVNTEIEYLHDTHGNARNLARVADQKFLRWDHADMIRSLDLGGGGTAFYQYDSDGLRTRKRVVNQNNLGGYWERIYLDGYERYRRYNGSGTRLLEEIESHHLSWNDERLLLVDDVLTAATPSDVRPDGFSVKAQTLFRYQYCNHLGSACLELDHGAAIISYEEYHPYGTSALRAMTGGIEAPPSRYRFTGMEKDEESGLGYHGKRFYVPWLGRWASADPQGLVDGLNVYGYVQGNPVGRIDRSGTIAAPLTPMQEGLVWEKYIMGEIGAKIPLVEQVTIRGVVDGKVVETVADGLALNNGSLEVFESKLNPTTKLSKAQEKLMAQVQAGGTFQISATDKKKLQELSSKLHLSPGGTPLKADKYTVVNRGNVNKVLQDVKALAADEVAVMVKSGQFIKMKKDEALAVERFISGKKPWATWEDALQEVRDIAKKEQQVKDEVAKALKAAKAAEKQGAKGAAQLGEGAHGASRGAGEQLGDYAQGVDESANNAIVGGTGLFESLRRAWGEAIEETGPQVDAGMPKVGGKPAATKEDPGLFDSLWKSSPEVPDAGTIEQRALKKFRQEQAESY